MLVMQLVSVARNLSSAAPVDHLRDPLSASTKVVGPLTLARTIRSHLHVVNCLNRRTSVCGDSVEGLARACSLAATMRTPRFERRHISRRIQARLSPLECEALHATLRTHAEPGPESGNIPRACDSLNGLPLMSRRRMRPPRCCASWAQRKQMFVNRCVEYPE